MTTQAIPEELMEAARELADDWAMPETEKACREAIARALHAAVLKEREACAWVAEEVASSHERSEGDYAREVWVANLIAAAIRSRGDA